MAKRVYAGTNMNMPEHKQEQKEDINKKHLAAYNATTKVASKGNDFCAVCVRSHTTVQWSPGPKYQQEKTK